MEITMYLLPDVVSSKNKLFERIVLKWWVYLEDDEMKFEEEIEQEIDLNLKEQFGIVHKLY